MLELIGIMAIAGALTGSVLMALFAGEALIGWMIRVMAAGVRRADKTAASQSGVPETARLLAGQRPRLQRV